MNTQSNSTADDASCASSCLTAKEWMELYNSAAAAHLDIQDALKRLLNAHHPKPTSSIADAEERQRAVLAIIDEKLDATAHARQALGKYDPFVIHNA